ncbi:Uncharacterised protein [[Clostridium] sordellii]|uniref:hypothetical protein n=1 Tax=Paraclostridium sordellii TaxID=1505 RepID=UPI0005DD9183|nr:hypothetical protein [Paeniclostridium sordellii]MDU1456143.1 hypothetical protein [Paeniclostridium sordellii]MDU6115799.1 hypothetical protein [Paeniclostridium sordellii]CEO13685.1 Uncharacterised protein [[Clostridium] sordellii] [Paeniclostridium sordellii]CEQ16403.1 Uncharacterised protein [[Clostridium] sordellii] [Paeniclostridium sordellii]CEQ26932.1 Uncharacterised protein [[Clostridium] sordellii] [Paeniclostridium sordellii]
MKKRYIIVILVLIVSCFLLFAIKQNEKDEKIDYKSKNYEKKIEPISKELAIKVLKSKYGNKVSNTEEDIKQVGDEYIVDVHVSVEDEEEGSLQAHVHNQSLGEQKINIYTGELVEEQKK